MPPKGTTTGQKKSAAPPAHPKYAEMIESAIKSLGERSGSSRQAICKYIKDHYKVGEGFEVHVKMALKRGVNGGTLVQTKGTGASGSFRIKKKEKPAPSAPAAKRIVRKTVSKPKPKSDKAAKPKPKKAAAAKPKKAAPKKTTASKPKKQTEKKRTAKPKTVMSKAAKPKNKPAKSPKKASK